MSEADGVAALLITGTVGSGKTTVADAAGELLAARGTPHAVVDLDRLRQSWPPPVGDRFNNAIGLANLRSVAANYWAGGARRLVMAGVIEQRSALQDYEQAVGCVVKVVRLRVDRDVVAARLHDRHRHDPLGLSWHLSRAPELDAILDQAAVGDAEVDASEREPAEVAEEVLAFAGW